VSLFTVSGDCETSVGAGPPGWDGVRCQPHPSRSKGQDEIGYRPARKFCVRGAPLPKWSRRFESFLPRERRLHCGEFVLRIRTLRKRGTRSVTKDEQEGGLAKDCVFAARRKPLGDLEPTPHDIIRDLPGHETGGTLSKETGFGHSGELRQRSRKLGAAGLATSRRERLS